ncbi:3'(2'),5'-bisphosphate nucleotidase CysQ [Cardiobacterium sp. Marseille-Q4385]|uniref:3'(2'),5'-bisphosphate nucleotidase CysQ family protein n=1 Tax=Cardiobacterium sp. Marseille-Q4385 TaxID=2866573 RepID=UPI001CE473CF|nr:3'(2'),5'-bisphosphate nucleotidase CysQ [Cardiobacterium sp. Marseille-Q4385]
MLNADEQRLIAEIAALAAQTGAAILSYYDHPDSYHVRVKDNHTPLTEADLAAHDMLVRGLPHLMDLPCLSEESDARVHQHPPDDYWLIDPIDGTREFIERSGQFCIAIARIQHGKPSLGFIYAPIGGAYWYALHDKGAYKYDGTEHARLHCRHAPSLPTIITARARLSRIMRDYLDANFGHYHHICCGSALKFCAIAEGHADIYPKLSPTTSQWDTAAGDILLREAGGGLRYYGNLPGSYGARSTINPPFLAYGAGFGEEALQAYFVAMQRALEPEQR